MPPLALTMPGVPKQLLRISPLGAACTWLVRWRDGSGRRATDLVRSRSLGSGSIAKDAQDEVAGRAELNPRLASRHASVPPLGSGAALITLLPNSLRPRGATSTSTSSPFYPIRGDDLHRGPAEGPRTDEVLTFGARPKRYVMGQIRKDALQTDGPRAE